jgi:hypothetical protein
VSDNSTADPGAGGDTFRTKDRAGIKTEIVGLDLTPAGGSETLMNGVMPVSDNSGSLTVDNAGTFAVQADTELTTADLDAGAGTDTRAVVGLVVAKSGGAANVSSVDPLPVSIASSVSVTSSSDRAEDTVAVSGHSGTPVLGVRNDSAAAKTSTDGDYSMLATDDAGRVGVTDLGGAISVDDNGGSLTVDNGGTFAVQADTELTTSDLDTGAGTDTRAVVGIALAASGGAVLAGSANPVPISDNSGSLTVDGTVTANAGTGPFPVSDNGGSITVDAAAASFAVNSAQVSGTATSVNSGTKDAGTQRVILASDQTVVPISDNSGSLTVDAPVGTPAFVRLSDGSAAITTLPVSLASLPALAAGSALAGRVNIDPQTANGLSIYHLVSAATTNATNVKASAGQLYGWYIYNSNAAARKVAFHNTAGTPTAGASVVFSIVIPPASAANVEYTMGLAFATGIGISTVTDLTDAGTTAVGASDLIINLFYK